MANRLSVPKIKFCRDGKRRASMANRIIYATTSAWHARGLVTVDLRLRSAQPAFEPISSAKPPNRRNKTLELDGLCIELIAPCGERFIPLTG